MILVISSCSKDEEKTNHKPVAAFSYSDEIDAYFLNNHSTDADGDVLTYQWSSDWDSINFNNSNDANPIINLPELTESKPINIKLVVNDGHLSDSVINKITLPKSTIERLYGLGIDLEGAHDNNVNYYWYLDQMNTGTYSNVNCGPTSVTMAIKWVNGDFTKTPLDARNTYRSGGGWWYTDDVVNYLNNYSVNNKTILIIDISALKNEIDVGNIAILCLDMYYIRNQVKAKWHIDKFYVTNKKGWGHFIVIKGYKIVDDETYFESYDPYSMGMKYKNDTLKGLDRYYRSADLDSAVLNWWNYAIIVSKNSLKSAQGVDITTIKHMPGL